MNLINKDIEIIKLINYLNRPEGDNLKSCFNKAIEFGWLKFHTSVYYKIKNKEREECEVKLLELGFEIPWKLLDFI